MSYQSIRLTLRQRIGQTLMIGFEGTTLTSELREMIERYHVGGVILFARNIESPQQVAELTNAIQQVAQQSGQPGLLIAIDQEGGRVARLTEATGFSEFPSAMAAAATGDVAAAEQIGRELAEELRAVGINVDFAPVLDVNNNPANPVIGTRSYGSTAAQVAAYGVAALRGIQSCGVLAVGKHFPGHGDTDSDSHIALPQVAHGRTRLEALEFVPFKAAIAAGVAGIMLAHVLFPAIEPANLPATLSAAALSDLLRGELGFAGLVFSDSLEMGALASLGYSPAQAAAAALAAGADVLLFNSGYDDHKAACALIEQRIEQGLPEARLDAAVERILQTKAAYQILAPLPANAARAASVVGRAEQRNLAQSLAARSWTLLRDEAGLLPLASLADAYVLESSGAGFGTALGLPVITLDDAPTPEQIAQAEQAASTGALLIIGLSNVGQKPGQIGLIERLLARTMVALVALRDPYDLLAFPHAPLMLATYATPPVLLGSLRDLLTGRMVPQGRLPVDLPHLFALGAGL